MAAKKSSKKAVRREGTARPAKGARKAHKGPPHAGSSDVQRRKQYTDEEKLRIVRDAAARGFKPAAAEYGMAKDGSIRSWIRQPRFLEAFREGISEGIRLGGKAPKLLARRYGVTETGELDPSFPVASEPRAVMDAAAGNQPDSGVQTAVSSIVLEQPTSTRSEQSAQHFASMLRELADVEERREALLRALGIPNR